MVILNNVSLGFYYFEIASVLRVSLMINGILFNSETWYGVTSNQIMELEKVDKLLLRKVFNTPFSTPTESLYLELGVIPLKFILKGRRLLFLHYILNLDDDELLAQFFRAQWNNPGKNDWTDTVQTDIVDLQINMSIEEIQQCPRSTFKLHVNEKCRELAFKSLIDAKNCHSKLANLSYDKLEMQSYLRDGVLNCKEARLLFSFRTRMVDVGCNFKNKASLLCPLCSVASDDQQHLLLCTKIHNAMVPVVSYNDIFGTDTYKMKVVLEELKKALSIREELLQVT